ncbi:MAG: class I SAM-dependent methyltransferase [Chloroflexota bacterium]
MPDLSRTDVMSRLFGYVRGLHATYVMDLGHRLGLFRALRNTAGLQPDELATSLGLDGFYIAKWCETAYSLELLEHGEAGYRLAPFIDDLLANPDHTYFIGGFPNIHIQTAHDYATYPERFRDGSRTSYQAHDPSYFQAIAEGTRSLPRMLVETALRELPEIGAKLEHGGTMVDFGCGAGAALCELAGRFPNLTCVGVDLEPESLRLAERQVQALGLEARVQVRRAGPGVLAAGQFDLATMLLVLHEIAPPLKAAALAECFAALKPGGALLILDESYPESVEGLRDPALAFSVMAQWFEMTWGNVINTRAEIRALLEGAGFAVQTETTLSRFYIVAAEKPIRQGPAPR